MSLAEGNQMVDGTRRAMPICDDALGDVDSFKYLGSFVQRDGGFVVRM